MVEDGAGVRGIHHPGIVVPDLEAAVAFYGALLGLTGVYDEQWETGDEVFDQGVGLVGSAARGVMLRGHNTYLDLWEYSAPPQQVTPPSQAGANELGFRHLSIEVDDVRATWLRVQELGGRAISEPVEFGGDMGAAVYMRDPFGNLLELTTAGAYPPPIADLPVSGSAPRPGEVAADPGLVDGDIR